MNQSIRVTDKILTVIAWRRFLGVVLLSAMAATCAGKTNIAVAWMLGDLGDDQARFQDVTTMCNELNIRSSYYNYIPIQVGSFLNCFTDVANQGYDPYSAILISHGIYDASHAVFLNKVKDLNAIPIRLSALPQSLLGRQYYCGMYGDNRQISTDDVGRALASQDPGNTFTHTGAPLLDGGAPPSTAVVYANGETFTVASGQTITVVGAGNIMKANNGATVNISGSDNVVTCNPYIPFVPQNNFIVIWSGSQNTRVENNCPTCLVNVGSNMNAIINGTGGAIGVCGSGSTITASSQSITSIGGANWQLNGGSNTIWAAPSNTIALNGSNNVANLSSNDFVAVYSNTFNTTINNNVLGNSINLGSNVSAAINGAGGYLGFCGNGTTASASNQTFSSIVNSSFSLFGSGNAGNVSAGSTATFGGSNNVVTSSGSTVISMTGIGTTGNTVNVQSSDSLSLTNGTDTTVNGTNALVTVLSSNTISGPPPPTTTVRTSGQRLNFLRSAYSTAVVNDNKVYGNNNIENIVNAPGSGNRVDITNFGNGNVVSNQSMPNGSIFRSQPTPSSTQSGSCATTWLITEIWYYVNPFQEISRRTYFYTDPLIFDFARGEALTQALWSSSAYMDRRGDGRLAHTAWGVAGNGYLVYDPAGRNTIGSANDLIAGFDQLRALSSLKNKVLDKQDGLWPKLKVWIDQDGRADIRSAHLVTLDQLGISSIDLSDTRELAVDNGNTIISRGLFRDHEGRIGRIAAVNLAFEPPLSDDVTAEISAGYVRLSSAASPTIENTTVPK